MEQQSQRGTKNQLIPILGGLNKKQLAQLIAHNKERQLPLHYGFG